MMFGLCFWEESHKNEHKLTDKKRRKRYNDLSFTLSDNVVSMNGAQVYAII